MTEAPVHGHAGARVQVFIPTYNRADRLERAVASVLGQTWPDVEVVVLDNHSTDHTAEVMNRLSAADARIRYVQHPRNVGMIKNFNVIASMVEGDYFAMLTDDDTYESEFVAMALRVFAVHPDVAFVACDAPTRHHGVVKSSQLDFWREGRHAAGAGVLNCLLGHYPIITNCLFSADRRDDFSFEPDLGNNGDGFILTSIAANHAIGVSRYISGYWNNDGDNASSLQGFDAGLVARIALAEYDLYKRLFRQGRFRRRWLVVVWLKRGLSVLVAADRHGFDALRKSAPIDRVFGPIARACLAMMARTHAIRLFPWILSTLRKRSRVNSQRGPGRHAH